VKRTTLYRGALVPAATLALVLSACGSGTSSAAGGSTSSRAVSSGAVSSGAVSSGAVSSGAVAAGTSGPADEGQPFGAACAQVPADGLGSFQGMSTAPVAAAAAANPVLSTLVQAVGAAHLTDSLNSQQEITVLAPANPAFEAVPANQRKTLLADVPQLTSVLTHHVIQGRLTPEQLAGRQTTLNNDTVTIEGSGQDLTISGDQTVTGKPASVICGNVPTANATVYIVDQVLRPQAAG
jgi:uncharacterized surface protein with fasciclin (FAS1) repeats